MLIYIIIIIILLMNEYIAFRSTTTNIIHDNKQISRGLKK